MRREFSAKVRLAAFDLAGGQCAICTTKLSVGKVRYDHRVPDALGGEPTLSNCQVLCVACHDNKTIGSDVPTIAKSKRIRQKIAGARVQPRPMPGSRKSQWKRRMDGTVVRRDEP